MKPSTLIAFAAAAGLASAQSISSACTDALQGVLGSPDAACLNPSALLTIFVGTDQSIPDTINNWLTGLCSQGACSDDVLAEVVNDITTGCASELGSDGAGSIAQMVQAAYPLMRNIMCLKDTDSNQLCVTETLNNVQQVVGQLTLSNLTISTLEEAAQKVLSNGAKLACTSCTKAAFGMASQLTAQFPEATNELDQICGPNFVDGSTDGTTQTAVSGVFTASKPNSALALSMNKLAGGFLFFVLSAFTLFA